MWVAIFLLDSNQNIQRFLYSAKSVTSLVTSNDLFDIGSQAWLLKWRGGTTVRTYSMHSVCSIIVVNMCSLESNEWNQNFGSIFKNTFHNRWLRFYRILHYYCLLGFSIWAIVWWQFEDMLRTTFSCFLFYENEHLFNEKIRKCSLI